MSLCSQWILLLVFLFAFFIFHCRSFSPSICTNSHRQYKIFMSFFQRNSSPLFFISRSSVLSLFFSLSFTNLSPTFSFSLSFSFYIFQICRHNNFHVFPEKSTAGIICQIWVVTSHQCGISALVSQTSFGGKTSGDVAKCRLFSQAILDLVNEFGDVFAHHRKICANRHSAKIPLELYLRTFANKWDWFCSRIQKYILGGFICNIRVKLSHLLKFFLLFSVRFIDDSARKRSIIC